ncbi:MAG: D-alanyl-D-alanine carboxypeptidase [Eubacteriales bacterium]|nr:D-alanyl-D-alanine carboxypeptidase [Eubacteriales bacterium]
MIKKVICCFLFIAFTFVSIPFSVTAVIPENLKLQIKSEAAILIDGDTGQILFEKDMHKKTYPASITKIMTGLLALEKGNLSDIITMSYDAVFSIGRDSSHVALDVGERITLEQALYALAIASANDAANGIAELIGGTMDNFSAMMSDRATEAGALNTNFTNAHGLYDKNHYTTAYDMARITMAAIKTPEFTKIFSTLRYEMPPTNKQPETRYFNCTNAMMVGKYKYEGIIAEKNGWTTESKHTLVTVAKRNGRTLIAVVLKAPAINDRWEDATALLDYGFDEFKTLSFSAEELKKDNYAVSDNNGIETNINLSSNSGFNCLVPKALTKDDVQIKYIAETDGANNKPKVKAVFALNPAYSTSLFTELGELEMQTSINNDIVPTDPYETGQTDNQNNKNPILSWFYKFVGILFVFIIFLYIRRCIILKRRRRRRKNRSYR